MTKDMYFEMCEMLGSEPVESEIPIELDDFPDIVQQVFLVYNMLSDRWDSMGGSYLGKDYAILFQLLDLYSVTEKQEVLLAVDFINQIDYARSDIIQEKQKTAKPAN